MTKHKAELEKTEPQQIKLAAEAKSLTKKIAEDERAAEKVSKDCEELAERIEGIEEDMEQLTEAEAVLDSNAAEAQAKAGVKLDEGKTAEYDVLKAEAAKNTAADRSQAESLHRQQKSDENSLAQVEADHAELKTKLESDKERLQKLKERWASINAAAEEARAQAQEVQRELQELQNKEAGDSSTRAALEAELEGVQTQLQGVKDDRQQSKQEEKMAECLETLIRLFPGVKGRLLDLCKPVQRKYDTAVTVAAGIEFIRFLGAVNII